MKEVMNVSQILYNISLKLVKCIIILGLVFYLFVSKIFKSFLYSPPHTDMYTHKGKYTVKKLESVERLIS